MNWKSRVSWGGLALLTAIVGVLLTRWITHVDRNAHAMLVFTYDQNPPLRLDLAHVTLAYLQRNRFRIPRVIIAGTQETVIIVTPATRSIAVNLNPNDITCGFNSRVFSGSSYVLVEETAKSGSLVPILLSPSPKGTVLIVPASLHNALAHVPNSEGVIKCTTSRPLAGEPTFTDRALTLRAEMAPGDLVLLDVSGLEDIDNLRFSGGFMLPLAGERARLLDSVDNVVSVEWEDVSAQEQRDIILVIVGALAAIAAAMGIEAIRPFIER